MDSEDQVTKLCTSIKNKLIRELPGLSAVQRSIILDIVDKDSEYRKRHGMVAGSMEIIPNRFEANNSLPKIIRPRIIPKPYPLESIETTMKESQTNIAPLEVLNSTIPKITHRFSVENIVVPIEAPATTENELDQYAMREMKKGRNVK
jgi:hypothetical protein